METSYSLSDAGGWRTTFWGVEKSYSRYHPKDADPTAPRVGAGWNNRQKDICLESKNNKEDRKEDECLERR